jgi:sec-independent protein translocase protein TatA
MLGLDNPIHILFLLILLLLVFGAKRLPEMGRSLGTGMRGFKESLNGEAGHANSLAQPQAPAQPQAMPASNGAEATAVANAHDTHEQRV